MTTFLGDSVDAHFVLCTSSAIHASCHGQQSRAGTLTDLTLTSISDWEIVPGYEPRESHFPGGPIAPLPDVLRQMVLSFLLSLQVSRHFLYIHYVTGTYLRSDTAFVTVLKF